MSSDHLPSPHTVRKATRADVPQLAEGAFLVIIRLPVVTLALPAAGARARLDAQSHLRGVRVRVAAAERVTASRHYSRW
jgi:hypothetical protein